MDAYKCPGSENPVVVDFVLFFPNYCALVAKAGNYVGGGSLHREPYQGHGFGIVLLQTVAQLASIEARGEEMFSTGKRIMPSSFARASGVL